MIAGVLLRNYKNYNNINFVPICDNTDYKFSAFIGNNGIGKSAVLESLDSFLNDREWNTTRGAKGKEAYICPVFLIEKERFTDSNMALAQQISDYFWNANDSINANIRNTPELLKLLEYRDLLKKKYFDTHFFILIGSIYETSKEAYFSTFHEDILKKLASSLKHDSNSDELKDVLSDFKQYICDLYSYIYIPVESSPRELLQLQNQTMQKLLRKDLLDEIENILNNKSNKNQSIVYQINNSLNKFMDEVNRVIIGVENCYEFKNAQGYKKNLKAKDIREKILDAYFPLRELKVNGLPVSQLSSGEQRKAIIDIAYSVLVSNGDNKTDREIILGIDEPESSMHISNCFRHFQMLEELAGNYSKQIIITTHWYGFLPIAQNGNLHYISNDVKGKRDILSVPLYNLMEKQRDFPDAIELKSVFDLATSIITYMRTDNQTKWIICEGSDDKIYLECILNGINNINILPMGGCGNVIKLYRIIYSSLTEKSEEKGGSVLFIIDTDKEQSPSPLTISYSKTKPNVYIRRLQLEKSVPKLFKLEHNGIYEQTEIEDCLIPCLYFEALTNVIEKSGDSELKQVISEFDIKDNAQNSMLRNDDACIKPRTVRACEKKASIIKFAEDENNKTLIALEYSKIFALNKPKAAHMLREEIVNVLNNKQNKKKS